MSKIIKSLKKMKRLIIQGISGKVTILPTDIDYPTIEYLNENLKINQDEKRCIIGEEIKTTYQQNNITISGNNISIGRNLRNMNINIGNCGGKVIINGQDISKVNNNKQDLLEEDIIIYLPNNMIKSIEIKNKVELIIKDIVPFNNTVEVDVTNCDCTFSNIKTLYLTNIGQNQFNISNVESLIFEGTGNCNFTLENINVLDLCQTGNNNLRLKNEEEMKECKVKLIGNNQMLFDTPINVCRVNVTGNGNISFTKKPNNITVKQVGNYNIKY